jgi:general L-amino acid transport system substrate-binding protein
MKRNVRLLVLSSLVIVLLAALSLPAHTPSHIARAQDGGGLLETIRARGVLNCGVNGQVPGFSYLDPDSGEWSGFDVDFCRALAAAVFGEVTAENLVLVPTSAQERIEVLRSGQIDVLIRNTTWTLQRDGELGVDFGPTTYYDGQGVMVRTELGAASLDDLDGASICTLTGTTTELNITEAMELRGLTYELVPLEQAGDTITAFEEGRCDILTSDQSQLAGLRSSTADPSLYVVLPEVISKEPLGPVYNENDSAWADVVDWTVYATITAEEFGITQENVDSFLESEDARIRRFLGLGEDNPSGTLIGLDNSFVVNVIKAVGNYSEIYERNVGIDTPLGLDRAVGLNRLWTEGGLIYAPAWR